MDLAARHFDWKAPSEDGQVLLWPSGSQFLRATQDNHDRLAAEQARFQGVPLAELRRRMRGDIGHADGEQLLIATGHQTELYHPGVWAKIAAIHCAAGASGGVALHLAVDTDAPKHLLLRWPGFGEAVTDDARLSRAQWSGALSPPSPVHLGRLEAALEAAQESWGFDSQARWFLQELAESSGASGDLASALAWAMHGLDRGLGLRHQATVLSPLLEMAPYLVFVHHLLARAEMVAGHYNAALAEYRRENRVRTAGRPMPDLHVNGERCESPFWLDDLAGGRRWRASVWRDGRGWRLEAPGEDDAFVLEADAEGWSAASRLGQWLARHRLRLAPRALTLTAWVRLLLVDQFVHGIGGARYDQVTDGLMTRGFGIEPPGFAVATATLYFPAASGRARVNVPLVAMEGHRLRHSLLGPAKMDLVRRIEQLPRGSPRRRQLFAEMHRRLAEAAAGSGRAALVAWEERWRQAQAAHAEEQVLFDRELFYGLQPRDRLEIIVERLEREFNVTQWV